MMSDIPVHENVKRETASCSISKYALFFIVPLITTCITLAAYISIHKVPDVLPPIIPSSTPTPTPTFTPSFRVEQQPSGIPTATPTGFPSFYPTEK